MLQIQRLLLKRCCSTSVTRVIQEKDIKAYAELTGQGFIEGLVNFHFIAIQFENYPMNIETDAKKN